jgi:hypothetical protein
MLRFEYMNVYKGLLVKCSHSEVLQWIILRVISARGR